MLPKAQIHGKLRKKTYMKGIKTAAATIGLIFASIFVFVQMLDFINGKVSTPKLSKAKAEGMSSVMLKQPTICSNGYSGNDGYDNSSSWQCRGMQGNEWVTCLGKECYRIK